MTLKQAFQQLSESEEFKSIAKSTDSQGTKYRVYLGRFKKGTLKAGAITEILIQHDYEVTANKVAKKVKGKK
jgi:hypothetical protein